MSKFYIILVVILVILGLVYWGYTLYPKGKDYSIAYDIVGRNHILEDSPYPENYNSNPPTSGDHYSAPAPSGYYEESLPDERLVHNLEHGDIWISYRSSVSEEILEKLKSFAGDPLIIITKRDENPADIALASWGRLDTFNIQNGQLDTERIQNFVLRYKNRGPENVPASMREQKK